jgi:hypothetical protein
MNNSKHRNLQPTIIVSLERSYTKDRILVLITFPAFQRDSEAAVFMSLWSTPWPQIIII